MLLSMQDIGYKKFHSALMPTVNPDLIIGVRVPQLRKFAKDFAKTPEAENFLNTLPHKYYEENNLHAFLIEQEKDFDRALFLAEKFLPFIDNWATCDMFRPPVFRKNPEKLLPHIYKWLNSDKTYTVRYAIGLLLSFYLGENFRPEFPERVSKIRSDEYYVNMMVAWYFQTALVKQYECAISYITGRRLSVWVHNKAIQKSLESLKISKETKEHLKTLKVKE
ncbi:MAG: DNA alkylation repair protein [Clostridia bacterium]|nr:DNA alkylation repair protein [Clostridia bacterium]